MVSVQPDDEWSTSTLKTAYTQLNQLYHTLSNQQPTYQPPVFPSTAVLSPQQEYSYIPSHHLMSVDLVEHLKQQLVYKDLEMQEHMQRYEAKMDELERQLKEAKQCIAALAVTTSTATRSSVEWKSKYQELSNEYHQIKQAPPSLLAVDAEYEETCSTVSSRASFSEGSMSLEAECLQAEQRSRSYQHLVQQVDYYKSLSMQREAQLGQLLIDQDWLFSLQLSSPTPSIEEEETAYYSMDVSEEYGEKSMDVDADVSSDDITLSMDIKKRIEWEHQENVKRYEDKIDEMAIRYKRVKQRLNDALERDTLMQVAVSILKTQVEQWESKYNQLFIDQQWLFSLVHSAEYSVPTLDSTFEQVKSIQPTPVQSESRALSGIASPIIKYGHSMMRSASTTTTLSLISQGVMPPETDILDELERTRIRLDQCILDHHYLLSYYYSQSSQDSLPCIKDIEQQMDKEHERVLELENKLKQQQQQANILEKVMEQQEVQLDQMVVDQHYYLSYQYYPQMNDQMKEWQQQAQRALVLEKTLQDVESRLRARDTYLQNTIMDTARRVADLEYRLFEQQGVNEDLKRQVADLEESKMCLERELLELDSENVLLQSHLGRRHSLHDRTSQRSSLLEHGSLPLSMIPEEYPNPFASSHFVQDDVIVVRDIDVQTELEWQHNRIYSDSESTQTLSLSSNHEQTLSSLISKLTLAQTINQTHQETIELLEKNLHEMQSENSDLRNKNWKLLVDIEKWQAKEEQHQRVMDDLWVRIDTLESQLSAKHVKRISSLGSLKTNSVSLGRADGASLGRAAAMNLRVDTHHQRPTSHQSAPLSRLSIPQYDFLDHPPSPRTSSLSPLAHPFPHQTLDSGSRLLRSRPLSIRSKASSSSDTHESHRKSLLITTLLDKPVTLHDAPPVTLDRKATLEHRQSSTFSSPHTPRKEVVPWEFQ